MKRMSGKRYILSVNLRKWVDTLMGFTFKLSEVVLKVAMWKEIHP
jgi:hypothetical protein